MTDAQSTSTGPITVDDAVQVLTDEGYDRSDVTAAIGSLIESGLSIEPDDADCHDWIARDELTVVRDQLDAPTDEPTRVLVIRPRATGYADYHIMIDDLLSEADVVDQFGFAMVGDIAETDEDADPLGEWDDVCADYRHSCESMVTKAVCAELESRGFEVRAVVEEDEVDTARKSWAHGVKTLAEALGEDDEGYIAAAKLYSDAWGELAPNEIPGADEVIEVAKQIIGQSS